MMTDEDSERLIKALLSYIDELRNALNDADEGLEYYAQETKKLRAELERLEESDAAQVGGLRQP
jgi:DNA repair exonuclease SbcCD ATPase subunit